MQPSLAITPPQAGFLSQINDQPEVEEYFLIGPIGSTKTFVMAYLHINICLQFPGSTIPVGRKNLSEARIGTFMTYLDVLARMGLRFGKDYVATQGSRLQIKFLEEGSNIIFVPLDKSKDPEWQGIKSIDATASGVDELDSVAEDGYDTLYARTGRKNTNGAPAVSISCCNPNDAWVKRNIYNKWKHPDKFGALPPNKKVIEFTIYDSVLYATGYYDRYATRPKAWRERYLFNNWDYMDDDQSLFKMRHMDSIMISSLNPGKRYMGIDPAGAGKDKAAIAIWQGDTLIDLRLFTTADIEARALPQEKHAPPHGVILARIAIEIAEEEGIGWQDIGVDGIGEGKGVVDEMIRQGWYVENVKAGAKAVDTLTGNIGDVAEYDMLRSQVMHHMAMATERRKVYFYRHCPHLETLKKQLTLHNHEQNAKQLKVESKQEIKKRLGESPDAADAVWIGYYKMVTGTKVMEQAAEKPTVGGNLDELYRGDMY